jgi:hypothetical protein
LLYASAATDEAVSTVARRKKWECSLARISGLPRKSLEREETDHVWQTICPCFSALP